MRRSYYKVPFNFSKFFEQRELEKLDLRESISQFISVVITTYFQEYTFDEDFGSEIWETDFDILTNPNVLKEHIRKSLQDKITTYEKRLANVRVQLYLGENLSEKSEKVRLKKYLTIEVNAKTIKTDEDYTFSGNYFLAPLSHNTTH